MSTPHQIFDRELLVRRRARAAPGASAHDFLLRRVADDFCERLALVKRNFPVAANVGAHHGVLSDALLGLPSIGSIIETDQLERCDLRDFRGGLELPSPRRGEGLGERPRIQAVVADEEALPFAEASLDLIVSGLALQLVNDLPGTLLQARRALKPDGLFLAALLGGETLKELREAWLIAEEEVTGGASPRVAPFADVRDLGALLQRAGFALPVADSDVVRVTYATPLDLMREIKAFGASNMLLDRRRVPVTRKLLLRAAEVYAERFAHADGRIPATFEIITLTAWVPHESQQKPLQPGSAKTRLADALGVREQGAGEKPSGNS